MRPQINGCKCAKSIMHCASVADEGGHETTGSSGLMVNRQPFHTLLDLEATVFAALLADSTPVIT